MAPLVFRDDAWLLLHPLTPESVLQYFSTSPFYDPAAHLTEDPSHGVEYGTRFCGNEGAGLFIIEKRRRHGTHALDVFVSDVYYVLYGSIYAAPDLDQVLRARATQAAVHVARCLDALVTAGDDDGDARQGPTGGVPVAGRDKERQDAEAAAVGGAIWAGVHGGHS